MKKIGKIIFGLLLITAIFSLSSCILLGEGDLEIVNNTNFTITSVTLTRSTTGELKYSNYINIPKGGTGKLTDIDSGYYDITVSSGGYETYSVTHRNVYICGFIVNTETFGSPSNP